MRFTNVSTVHTLLIERAPMIVWKIASILILAVLVSCSADEGPYFIPGSATLPTCTEPPAFDLTGGWSDNPGSIVSIRTVGCDDAPAGSEIESCPLGWEMTQTGADVEILVDMEYRILGRLCGAELHLQGGWWLPVQDAGECTYDEDSAAEVGIQMGGSTLTVAEDEFSDSLVATGILEVGGPCEATYEVTLFQFLRPPR